VSLRLIFTLYYKMLPLNVISLCQTENTNWLYLTPIFWSHKGPHRDYCNIQTHYMLSTVDCV
jgi:hypothetical protein